MSIIIYSLAPFYSRTSAGLKSAVNSLAVCTLTHSLALSSSQNRLALPRDSESALILVQAIIEWAKKLCYTSCGNYLCQQLLERAETKDKLTFIDQIRDEIVAIASDKFGTHVLCKAISVKELEVGVCDCYCM